MPGSELALTRGTVRTVMDAVNVKGVDLFYSGPFSIENNDRLTVFVKAGGTTPKIRVTRCYSFSAQDPPEVGSWAEVALDGTTEDELSAEFTTKVWTFNKETLKYCTWMRYKAVANVGSSSNATLTIVVAKQIKGHRLE